MWIICYHVNNHVWSFCTDYFHLPHRKFIRKFHQHQFCSVSDLEQKKILTAWWSSAHPDHSVVRHLSAVEINIRFCSHRVRTNNLFGPLVLRSCSDLIGQWLPWWRLPWFNVRQPPDDSWVYRRAANLWHNASLALALSCGWQQPSDRLVRSLETHNARRWLLSGGVVVESLVDILLSVLLSVDFHTIGCDRRQQQSLIEAKRILDVENCLGGLSSGFSPELVDVWVSDCQRCADAMFVGEQVSPDVDLSLSRCLYFQAEHRVEH